VAPVEFAGAKANATVLTSDDVNVIASAPGQTVAPASGTSIIVMASLIEIAPTGIVVIAELPEPVVVDALAPLVDEAVVPVVRVVVVVVLLSEPSNACMAYPATAATATMATIITTATMVESAGLSPCQNGSCDSRPSSGLDGGASAICRVHLRQAHRSGGRRRHPTPDGRRAIARTDPSPRAWSHPDAEEASPASPDLVTAAGAVLSSLSSAPYMRFLPRSADATAPTKERAAPM